MIRVLAIIFVILVLGLTLMRLVDHNHSGSEEQDLFSKNQNMISIVTIYDNYLSNSKLTSDWGFSCLIKTENNNILFDTGAKGEILLENMRKLAIDPKTIDSIVISHDHYDHYGGLRDILKENNNLTVYTLSSLQQAKKIAKNQGAKIVEIDHPEKVFENVHTTGELGTGIKEQCLVVKTEKGLVIITGCSHSGIVNIVSAVENQFPEQSIYLVLGGFHLFSAGDLELRGIINSFRESGVQKVAPCHCSGDNTRKLFKQEYQSEYINNGAGKLINI